MEYFDQFPGEDITPAGSFASDPEKDEEELEEMLRQQRDQAAQVQQEQEQPAPAAEDDRNFIQQAQDFAAEALGLRSQEESQEIRDKGLAEKEALQEEFERREQEGGIGRVDLPQVTTPEINVAGVKILPEFTTPDGIDINPTRAVGEITRAYAGGVAGVVEQPIRFAQEIMGQEASFNLGIAENKTAIGNFARSSITMLGLMKGAGKIAPGGMLGTNLTKASTKLGVVKNAGIRLAGDAYRGALADFVMDPGESNLFNELENQNPELHDTFLMALAHDDDDNTYIRRLKNMAEGGIFGIAVDGIGEFIGALRAARKAKGGGREAVIQAMDDYFQGELDLGNVSTKPTKELGAHDVFTEVSDGDFSRLNQLNAYELKSLVQDYGISQFQGERFLRAADPEVAMEAVGKAIYTKKLPNGSEIDWMATKVDPAEIASAEPSTLDLSMLSEEAQTNLRRVSDARQRLGEELQNQNIIRIDWDISEGGELGSAGTRLYKQFGEVAKEQKPGTIIQAEAADDGFGSKGTSGAQQRRAQGSSNDIAREVYLKENPFTEEELEGARKLFDAPDAETPWDAMPQRVKDQWISGYEANGKLDAGDPESNVRERLYQRSGLSEPNEAGQMYGIVKYKPDGRKFLQPLDFSRPIQEQVDEAMDSAFQFELDVDSVTGETRQAGILIKKGNTNFDPNVRSRLKESTDNNASSVETNLYEPNERAAITSGTTPTEAATSLIDAAGSTNARRMATDETFRGILASPDAETALQGVVKAVADNLDVDAIYDKLRAANNGKQEWILESIPILNDFLESSRGANDFSSLTQLLQKADGTVVKQYMTDEGALAVRVLAKDTANQISDLARQMQEVDAVSGDSYRQAEMLLDRMEVLSKMNIEASYKAGSQLQRRNTQSFNIREILGGGDGDAALKQAKSDEAITKLREALADGEPKARQEFRTLADAVVLADGNPEKIMSFWQKWRTVGAAGLRTAMYNGYLSATQSQLRNLVGNEFNILLRPASQAIGFAAQGNFTEARIQLAAYHGLWEMHGEAFDIFKKSFAKSAEDTSQVVRFDDGQPGTGRMLVENMKASAKTQGERGAAELVDMYYSVFNSPFVRMPTRGLQAADDAARTLVARMELKKDAMRSSFEKGQGFKVDADRYAKLAEMKIDGEGNLLDQRLLDTAKEVTFQEDLQGFGKTLQDLSNTNPVVKLMFPFVKTPINIMRQTASYIPGVHQRFIKDFQDAIDAGDVEKIAMYKGREAIGYMTLGSAVGLAAAGLITGKGPADKQKRELWLKNNQPNSIKTPFGWVSYETIEPLNTILSASVDLIQMGAAGNQSAYDRSFAQFAYSMSAATVEKSYFQGMIDTAALLNIRDPRWGDLAQRKIAQTGNTLVLPFSGARAQLSRLLQPGKQEFDNVWQQEMARALPTTQRIFGVDRVDILENKPMQYGDYVNNIWNTLTPFDVTNDDPNSVAKQLGELGVDITLSFSDTFKGIDLTAREKQQFNQYLADTGIGKDLKDLLNDEDFQDEVEAWKESGKAQDPSRWLDLIHDKLRQAKREARAAMLAENPTFADKVDLNLVQRDLLKQGRYNQEPETRIKEQLKFILEY